MGRIIEDSVRGEFYPMVGLRTIGNYVKGQVKQKGQTTNGNPVVTLSLIDLDGSTSVSESKGVYKEVDVNEGDLVQVIGSVKQLKEKLPQLEVGEIVTITHTENRKIPNRTTPMQIYKVEVE